MTTSSEAEEIVLGMVLRSQVSFKVLPPLNLIFFFFTKTIQVSRARVAFSFALCNMLSR